MRKVAETPGLELGGGAASAIGEGFSFAPSSNPQGGGCRLPGYMATRSNSLAFLEKPPGSLQNSFSAPIGTVVFIVCNLKS